MNKINIALQDAYDVYIGGGVLDKTAQILKEVGITGKLAIVSDSNVAPLYLERLEDVLRAGGFDCVHYVFPAGEESKNIDTLSDILEFFAESGLTRRDTAIALGGGVTGDMTGFAAGVYMRGISYVQMPTTLLAAVDSSVGGKTAVDLRAGKNLAGLFIQPKAVICDTDTLDTLPPAVYADGMAEVIKTAILGDEELFEFLESAKPYDDLSFVISRCVEYKGKVVCEDEYENGIRKLLNLGHTPAHSIEKLSSYSITHGHAVAMGLGVMTRSARCEGLISDALEKRILGLLDRFSLPSVSVYNASDLARTAFYDKKRQGNTISLIKIAGIGKCFIEKFSLDEVHAVFSRGMSNEN